MKTTVTSVLAVVVLVAAEGAALACSCAAFLTFDQVAARAPIVAVGRVSSIGSFRSATRGGTDPQVIEIEVVSVVKGALEAERVDVWNESAGSSCGGALAAVEVGSYAVLALRPARAEGVAPEPVLRRTGVRDLRASVLTLAQSACGESQKHLKDQRELDRWVGRRIR